MGENGLAMLLTGTHHRTLDEKCRVAIPKPLREGLENRDSAPVYVAPGLDGSLAVYPEDTFRHLGERLAAASPTARGVRDYARLFFARASAARIDKQGRLRIPAELAQWAELSGEVVLVGVQDRMEIWCTNRWNRYMNERADQYDAIAESAFDPPGDA